MKRDPEVQNIQSDIESLKQEFIAKLAHKEQEL
jgi:hypothetical protein